MPKPQQDLFASGDEALPKQTRRRKPPIGLAEQPTEYYQLNEQLPPSIYIGASSWYFPGWEGLVWDQKASLDRVRKQGLAALSQHPLLRCSGIDRTYYNPPTLELMQEYAACTGPEFRFLLKAHKASSMPSQRYFLDASYLNESQLEPMLEGLQEKFNVLVLQFSPGLARRFPQPEAFAEALDTFLSDVTHPEKVAFELRDGVLLTNEYRQVLQQHGAAHCYSINTGMLPLAEQIARLSGDTTVDFPFAQFVMRWNLNPQYDFETAKARYSPFSQIIDPNASQHKEISQLILQAYRSSKTSTVIINNKAEGSAPLSVARQTQWLVQQITTAAS